MSTGGWIFVFGGGWIFVFGLVMVTWAWLQALADYLFHLADSPSDHWISNSKGTDFVIGSRDE